MCTSNFASNTANKSARLVGIGLIRIPRHSSFIVHTVNYFPPHRLVSQVHFLPVLHSHQRPASFFFGWFSLGSMTSQLILWKKTKDGGSEEETGAELPPCCCSYFVFIFQEQITKYQRAMMTCSVLLEGIRSNSFVGRQDRSDIFLPFVLYGTFVLRIFLLKVVILLTHTYGGEGCVSIFSSAPKQLYPLVYTSAHGSSHRFHSPLLSWPLHDRIKLIRNEWHRSDVEEYLCPCFSERGLADCTPIWSHATISSHQPVK